MFLAAYALAATAVWRNCDEVYDLALYRGQVVAATSGGAFVEGRNHEWRPLGSGSPAPIRKLRISGNQLQAVDRTGAVFQFEGSSWRPTESSEPLSSVGLPSPTLQYGGQMLTSPWGGRFLTDVAGHAVMPRDPAEGDYALMPVGTRIYAATPNGVYEYASGVWALDTLPSTCPAHRPQGLSRQGASFVLGGMNGLFVRRGGVWTHPSKEPVRQILGAGTDVWALYGSGAVDKLDVPHDQLVFDAINAGAKRPWTSCLAAFEGTVLFGGQGGWIERSKRGITEHYFKEIDNDVVMAAAGSGPVRWIGTQKSGLLRFGNGPLKQWNPGNGLTDTWVTALLHTRRGLYVATATDGLYLLVGDNIQRVDSPTKRPRHLTVLRGQLVVGGMDGAWVLKGSEWQPLPTNGEETTSLAGGQKLVVCTVSGVYFF